MMLDHIKLFQFSPGKQNKTKMMEVGYLSETLVRSRNMLLQIIIFISFTINSSGSAFFLHL